MHTCPRLGGHLTSLLHPMGCLLEKGELRGDCMKGVGMGGKDRPLWPHVQPICLSVEGEAAA